MKTITILSKYNNSAHKEVSFCWKWHVVHALTSGPYECFETWTVTFLKTILVILGCVDILSLGIHCRYMNKYYYYYNIVGEY